MSVSSDEGDLFARTLEVGSLSLTVTEDWEAGLGGTVWEGAHVLAAYFESDDFAKDFWVNKRVIEIGAGCGLPGIAAAALGANVILTDIDSTVPLLERNSEANKAIIKGSIESKPLCWGRDSCDTFAPPLDIVLAADVVYEKSVVPLLVQTMSDLSGPETLLLLSFFPRVPDAAQEFWRLLPLHFEVTRVDDSKVQHVLSKPLGAGCGVFRLKKRDQPLPDTSAAAAAAEEQEKTE